MKEGKTCWSAMKIWASTFVSEGQIVVPKMPVFRETDLFKSKIGFHSEKTLLSFTTGLTRSPNDVFSLTDLTIPSMTGKTWMTLAKGQRPRGVKSSRIHTKSSTCKFFDVLRYLHRTCWVGKYSRRKRFQKWYAICCDERQPFERFYFLPMKTQGDKLTDERPRRKWFGVSGKGSFMSYGTFVRGLEYMLASISQETVLRISSVKVLEPMTL